MKKRFHRVELKFFSPMESVFNLNNVSDHLQCTSILNTQIAPDCVWEGYLPTSFT